MKWELTQEQEKYICDNYHFKTSTALGKELEVPPSKISNVWYKYGYKNKLRRLYSLNDEYFSNIENENQTYILGFLMSDGTIYKKDNGQDILRWQIHKTDRHILEDFKIEFETDKPIMTCGGSYVSLEIVSNKIVKDLERLGVTERKTYGNTIINFENDLLMLSFIRGYIDGDGHVNSKNKKISISGYQNNMSKIQSFLETRNIFSTFFVDKRKINPINNDKFGELTFNKTQTYCLLKSLKYEECNMLKLERKTKSALEIIRSIEDSSKISDKEIVLYYKYAVQKLS